MQAAVKREQRNAEREQREQREYSEPPPKKVSASPCPRLPHPPACPRPSNARSQTKSTPRQHAPRFGTVNAGWVGELIPDPPRRTPSRPIPDDEPRTRSGRRLSTARAQAGLERSRPSTRRTAKQPPPSAPPTRVRSARAAGVSAPQARRRRASESAVSEEESEAEEGLEEGREADGLRLVPWTYYLPRDGQPLRFALRHTQARRLALEKWLASNKHVADAFIGLEEDLWTVV